jgi:hypothetical protein
MTKEGSKVNIIVHFDLYRSFSAATDWGYSSSSRKFKHPSPSAEANALSCQSLDANTACAHWLSMFASLIS